MPLLGTAFKIFPYKVSKMYQFSFAYSSGSKLNPVFFFICRGLAISANRKNVDDHIVLLRWSLGDEKNDVAVVDINRDKWIPRIKLQGG